MIIQRERKVIIFYLFRSLNSYNHNSLNTSPWIEIPRINLCFLIAFDSIGSFLLWEWTVIQIQYQWRVVVLATQSAVCARTTQWNFCLYLKPCRLVWGIHWRLSRWCFAPCGTASKIDNSFDENQSASLK